MQLAASATVIGYGNDLRSDDGIGQRIANTIESWHLSRVQSLAVPQLTPELAINLAGVKLAIFVDACISHPPLLVQVKSLLPISSHRLNSHLTNPQSLLMFTQSLYGNSPSAWLVTVPGINFEIGDRLSPVAEAGMAIALIKITEILNHANIS